MTAATLTRSAAELYATNIVREANNGRCQISGLVATGEYGSGNWCHRVPEGQGCPRVPAGGLWLDHAVHMVTHSARDLSRRAGWMIRPPVAFRWTTEEWSAYVRPIPALCIVGGQDGWWLLDASGDGLARLADDTEVAAAGLDPTLTLPEALAELERVTGWRAA